MPQITGQTVLPDDTTPLAGFWQVRIYSDVEAAIGPGTKVRAGELRVPDNGTGASVTLPAGFYRARFVSRARSGSGQVHLPPVGQDWYVFELTADTSWSAIMTTPAVLPVEPSDVILARQARDAAEAFAEAAQASAEEAAAGGGGASTWAELADKPATFPPSGHNHDDRYFTETEADARYATPATVATASTADRDRGNHTGTQTSASISDFTEAAQDAAAAMLAQGTGVTLSYNDAGNTLTITSTGTGGITDPEVVRDTIGTALVGVGVISVVVNDAADTITISSTATANSTDAQLRDRSTHSGMQPISSVTDLQTTLDAKAPTSALVPTVNAQTGTTYTPVLADGNNTLVTLTNAAAVAVTLPTNATVAFPIGTTLQFKQTGAGAVTVTPASGVTQAPATLSTSGAGHEIWATKTGTNTWSVILLGASASGGGAAAVQTGIRGKTDLQSPLATYAWTTIPLADPAAQAGNGYSYVTVPDPNVASNPPNVPAFKINTAGLWLVELGARWEGGAAGIRTVAIQVNAFQVRYGDINFAGRMPTMTAVLALAVNDIVHMAANPLVGSTGLRGYGVVDASTYLRLTYLGASA